jgi:hypothetical protein
MKKNVLEGLVSANGRVQPKETQEATFLFSLSLWYQFLGMENKRLEMEQHVLDTNAGKPLS